VDYKFARVITYSPLLGIAIAFILSLASGGDAIDPQGGGGPLNTVGVFALMFGIYGWLVSIPLGILITLRLWMRKEHSGHSKNE
jgi:hypothetical protein